MSERSDSGPDLGILAGLTLLAFILVPWYVDESFTNIWGALVVALVLGAIALPLVKRIIATTPDIHLARLLPYAIVAKIAGTLGRYYVTFTADRADAEAYHIEGARLAEFYRQLDFSADIGRDFVGTGFIRAFTGVVYSFTGANRLAGFLVFSFLSFWGLYFFYRAFCVAFPAGERRRYLYLIFFLPSLLFWPSSIGKEAWMVFALGLTSLGAARLLAQARGGYLLLSLGLTATAVVRPHLTLIALGGIGLAFLLRRAGREVLAPVSKAIGLIAFVLLGSLVVSRTETFFGVEDLSTGSVETVLEDTNLQTEQGGSAFAATPVRTPLDIPLATVTVLFRPFPFEAHNLTAWIASAEATLLLYLLWRARHRLARLPRLGLTEPFVAMSIGVTILFVFAFSSLGNFGILARQRVQVLPFLLVVLAIPMAVATIRGGGGPAEGEGDRAVSAGDNDPDVGRRRGPRVIGNRTFDRPAPP